MAEYVVLGNYTQKGLEGLKQRVKDKPVYPVTEQLGIKVVGIWVTMGRYDFVTVYDAPDDETMAPFFLTMLQTGSFTTETLRAFKQDELAEIVAKLPG